jgi:imidazole glycerol-phosphate synthase subunit HisH
MVNVAIFDYGAGNLFSLKAALERNGAQNVIIIHDMKSLNKFDGLVLPGVGNFDPAVKSIEPYKDIFIKSIEEDFMPILGICLGMEMLFNHSEEGTRDGLKILDGKVIILPKKKVKFPHMGWNNLEIIKKESKLLQGIKDGSWAYFVHSYLIAPENNSIVSAIAQYGVSVPAIVEEGNLYGTQFHPEKSGKLGAIIMKNFLNVCSDQK